MKRLDYIPAAMLYNSRTLRRLSRKLGGPIPVKDAKSGRYCLWPRADNEFTTRKTTRATLTPVRS